MDVTERTFNIPLAESVPPNNPMASYWLSEKEKLLLVKVGFASKDITIGVTVLDPKLLLVTIGLEAFNILNP